MRKGPTAAHYGGADLSRPREKAPVDQPAAATESAEAPAPTPFHRLADYAAIPRIGGLALSREGRLAIAVQTLDPEKKKWVSALWEVDPEGRRPAHRLTRSAPGESSPAWAPDGSLLFTSARPDPEAAADKNGEPKPALWALPPGGGEARLVLARSGGVSGFAGAADSGDVALLASTMPGAADAEADEARRKERKDAGVSAVLHESYPVRFWDHDLGPDVPHVFWLGQVPPEDPAGTSGEPAQLRDLTPDAGPPLGAGDDIALSPDGRFLARG